MPTLAPCLWFDRDVEEAVAFYATVFPDTEVRRTLRAGDKVMSITFALCGRELVGINGGPHFTFTEAISMMVQCDSQAEIDRLWTALTAGGGAPSQCGWLKDRFGLSWQIVPRELTDLLADPDPATAQRVMTAMLGMKKLDLAALRAAQRG